MLHEIAGIERLLVRLDERPWDAIHRIVLGAGTIPAVSILFRALPGLSLVAFFVLMLMALRIVPVIVRKLVPFSKEAQTTWYTRRQLAKDDDSYQWQKLLWIGSGLAAYLVIARETDPIPVALAAACLVSGAAGLVAWRKTTIA